MRVGLGVLQDTEAGKWPQEQTPQLVAQRTTSQREKKLLTNTAHLRWDTNGSSECRTVIPRSWKIG